MQKSETIVEKHLSLLSKREKEIYRLIVKGLSNREIGDLLFIDPKTARYHCSHIYEKIGVTSRFKLLGMLANENTL